MKAFWFLLLTIASCCGVSLKWDLNTEPHLGGYNIHFGTTSGQYEAVVNVGKVATYNIDEWVSRWSPGTTTFIVVKAYNTKNMEGKPSNEVSLTITNIMVDQNGNVIKQLQ